MTARNDSTDLAEAQRKWPSGAQKRSAEWGEAAARALWEGLYAPWIDDADGRSFLDVGCAWGYLFEHMLDRCTPERLIGVDVMAHWEGAPYNWRSETRAQVELHCGDVCSAPLEDKSFDYILCAGVLMSLSPTRLDETLRRMRELLRPGGELLLRTHAFTAHGGMMLHRAYALPYLHMQHGEELLRDRFESVRRRQLPRRALYTNWLTASSYLTAFLDAGFEILDVHRSPNRYSPSMQERILAEFPASRDELTVNQLEARLVRPAEHVPGPSAMACT